MTSIRLYHRGSRQLQQEFGSTRLADRLVDVLAHQVFADRDIRFIESRPMFFLATADADGRPDCSYKGGDPGFVQVTGADTLEFPSYDGNGMFKSLGNILVNPSVGLLFIDFESPRRLRVNGQATVQRLADSPADATTNLKADPDADHYGAQLVVRIQVEAIFPNCPRYIHQAEPHTRSENVPRPGQTPPIPEWKTRDQFNDVLPDNDPARR